MLLSEELCPWPGLLFEAEAPDDGAEAAELGAGAEPRQDRLVEGLVALDVDVRSDAQQLEHLGADRDRARGALVLGQPQVQHDRLGAGGELALDVDAAGVEHGVLGGGDDRAGALLGHAVGAGGAAPGQRRHRRDRHGACSGKGSSGGGSSGRAHDSPVDRCRQETRRSAVAVGTE